MRGIPVRLAVCALAAALLTAAALRLVGGRVDTPTADEALIELKTLNAVALAETSGPYSRFGWSHPGPILFYAQAPVYVLGRRQPASLFAGAVLINLSFIALALHAAGRMGRWSSFLGAAAVCVVAWRAPGVLASSWNPHLLLFPWLALVACGGAWVARGGAGMLAAVVWCASWLVQTHIGAGPCVLLFVGTMAALRRPRLPARLAAALLAFGVLLWTPMLVDVVRHGSESNPWQIAGWFAEDTHGHLGWRDALKAAGESLTAFVRPQPLAVPVGWAWRASGRTAQSWAIASGVLLVTLLAARRMGAAAALTASVFAGAVYTAWSVRGEMVDHLLFWLGGGLPAVVVIAAGAQGELSQRFRTLNAIVLGFAFALCAGLAMQQLAAQPVRTSPEVSLATSALLAQVDRGLDRAVVDLDDGCWGEAAGIVARLRSAHYAVRVHPSLGFMYGRASTAADLRGLLRVAIRRELTVGGQRMLASHGAPQIVAGGLQIWLIGPDAGRAP